MLRVFVPVLRLQLDVSVHELIAEFSPQHFRTSREPERIEQVERQFLDVIRSLVPLRIHVDVERRPRISIVSDAVETGREQGEFDFRGKARSKAAAILATIQGSRQLARIHGADMLEATFAQIRTDLGLET
mgnify:CR=1 FL=1